METEIPELHYKPHQLIYSFQENTEGYFSGSYMQDDPMNLGVLQLLA